MERAVDYAPFPTEFPVAQTAPVWISHTLRYAMSGAYSTSPSGGSYYSPPATTTPTPAPTPTTTPTPAPTPPPATTTAPVPPPTTPGQ